MVLSGVGEVPGLHSRMNIDIFITWEYLGGVVRFSINDIVVKEKAKPTNEVLPILLLGKQISSEYDNTRLIYILKRRHTAKHLLIRVYITE